MSTMEHLFMQIFDRKAWIEGQLKHQIRSYVESLAYNLLADGKQPPSWLWAEGADGFGVADLKVHKEHLASGILNPLPWSTTPSANNSGYFILPTFKADKVTQVNKVTETCASNKNNCAEYSDKALPNSSQLYPYGKAVAEVVEACAERDSPVMIHHSEHRQRDMDNHFCEKEKSLNSLGEKRSKEEHNCRLTCSSVSSVKVDSVKESLSTSESLHFHNVDVGRVTRSRMVSHRDSLDKLSEPSEALNCVKGVVFKAAESETAFKSIPSVNLDNIACNDGDNLVVSRTYFPGTAACLAHSCLEMPSVADSMLPNSSLLVEPKKLLFDCTEDCGLIKNLGNPCEIKNSGTSVISLSELDVVQSAKGDLPCVDLVKMDGSDWDNSLAKIAEMDKLLNGVSGHAEASECHSHPSSGRKSSDWDVCSTSSLDALANHAVEYRCSSQIKGLLNCGFACSSLETNTLTEPNHLEFHNIINDSGSKSRSVPALETETKPSPSIMAFTNIDVVRTSRMEFSSDSNQAHAPFVNTHLHEYNVFPTVEVMNYTEEAHEVSGKMKSFRTPVECEIEEQYTEQLLKETNNNPLHSIKAAHDDVCLEADNPDTSTVEAAMRSALETNSKLMAAGTGNKVVELQLRSRNSSSDCEISGPCKSFGYYVPSSNKATKCLSAQKAVGNESTMKLEESTAGKRSYASVTHSTQPKARYFLRSSTSSKSLSSLQGNLSASCTKNNSMVLGTELNEICAGPKIVAENIVNYHMLTPNSKKTQNEQAKPRYLLRSLNSHDNVTLSGTSHVGCRIQSMKTTPDAREITWPKRRRIDKQSSIIHGTSPRLRFKHFFRNQETSECRYNINNAPMDYADTTEIGDPALKSPLELLRSSKKHCTMEDCLSLKENDQAVVVPLLVEQTQEEQCTVHDTGILFKDETRVSELMTSEPQHLYTSDDGNECVLACSAVEHEIGTSPISTGRSFKDKEISDVDTSHMHDTTEFAHYGDDLVGCDDTMPEFEGFSILPSITDNFMISDCPSLRKERISVPEHLCKARNMLTPVPNLSSKYKIHELPDFGQSVPSGFLERMNFSCTLQFSDAGINHFGESGDGKFAGYGDRGLHIDDNFPGGQFSHSLPSSTVSKEVRKPPLTPQAIKFSHEAVSGMTSGSSGNVGSNPELICFRIDENSTIANGNEHDDGSESSEENIVSKGNKNSAKRKALVDVTQNYHNALKMVSDSKQLLNRESLESVNSESYVGTRLSSHLSLGSGYASKIEKKENVDHSVNKNRGRKAALSLRNRSSKTRLSGKRIRSQSTSEKGCKINNIISNVTSFIPLVRQKQKAAEPLKGKKEIKVKALEAAEAAKRLEEKKQNEREMRKVAAKLERGRLEQENARQAELKQKQKEEEKRKKEADIAARKRQREEEGKQEKERKRRCIEEARKQQKELEEKSRALKVEKELQRKASDEKERKKEMEVEAKNQLKSEKTGRVAGSQEGTNVQLKATNLIAVPTTCASNILQVPDDSNISNDIEKVTGNAAGLQEAKIYILEANQDMQSYEMTPYRDSDDEGGDEEIMRESKYVPLWARRECLEQIILSKQHLDPTKIFTRKRSFNLNEVLPTRITRRPI